MGLLYVSYMPNGFVWLDHGDIELKRAVIPITKLHEAFFTRFGETGFYRPIVTVVNSIDSYLYGSWAPGYHLTNIVLHILVVISVPIFLSVFIKYSGRERLAILIVAAVHPLNWLVIGAISYRPEILYTLLTMWTIITFNRMVRKPSILNQILLAVCFALSLFSKETALVVTPILLVIVYVWKSQRHNSHKKMPFIWYEWGIIFIILVAYVFLRMRAVPEMWRTVYPQMTLSEWWGIRWSAAGRMFLYLLTPVRPPLSDAMPIVGWFHIAAVWPFMVALGVCIIIVVKRLYTNAVVRLCAIIAVTLFPVFQILPAPRFFSPHYGYFAAVLMGGVAVLVFRCVKNWSKLVKIVLLGVSMIWILVSAYSLYSGGVRFFDDRELFLPETKMDVHYLEAYQYLGDYYFYEREGGQVSEDIYLKNMNSAVDYYNRALRTDAKILAYVDRYTVGINLAGAYFRLGKLDAADRELTELSHRGYENELLDYNRAVIAFEQKKYDRAITIINKRKAWKIQEAYLLLAKAQAMKGK